MTNYRYPRFVKRVMPNNNTDIKSKSNPVIREASASNVVGMEKYLVSLKIVITDIDNTDPRARKSIPGIPR